VKAAAQFHDLAVIHFDAHADLREEYLGEEMSHSAVIRHISKFVKDIRQIGIRSGTKEEFDFAHANGMNGSIDDLKGKKIFVTVDLDVLDPSIMSGTGTPEAGGMDFNTLVDWFARLKNFDIIGADVVELAPDYDASGVSTATAAKVIRELLMVLC
jgi:agmatinase